MSVTAIGNTSNLGGLESVGAKAAGTATAAATSSSSNVTTVVTMADGATVTTVRNKANEIVSISTTPATRPPEVAAPQSSSTQHSGGISLLA